MTGRPRFAWRVLSRRAAALPRSAASDGISGRALPLPICSEIGRLLAKDDETWHCTAVSQRLGQGSPAVSPTSRGPAAVRRRFRTCAHGSGGGWQTASQAAKTSACLGAWTRHVPRCHHNAAELLRHRAAAASSARTLSSGRRVPMPERSFFTANFKGTPSVHQAVTYQPDRDRVSAHPGGHRSAAH